MVLLILRQISISLEDIFTTSRFEKPSTIKNANNGNAILPSTSNKSLIFKSNPHLNLDILRLYSRGRLT